MTDQQNDTRTARLEQLSMAELKAIHVAIFGEQVHRAQRRALVSRIRQAIGRSEVDLFDDHNQSSAGPVDATSCSASREDARRDTDDASTPRATKTAPRDGPQEGLTPPGPQVAIPLITRPLNDLCIAELQLRCLLMSGRPTLSRNRTYLERIIRKMEKHGPVTPRPMSKTGFGGHECRNLSVRLPIRALAEIDSLCMRLGIHSRSAFMRQSIYRYLCELGETKIASLLATSL